MIAGKRNIKDGSKYNKFFPKPDGTDRVVNKDALLSHTIVEMRSVINETLWHTRAIAEHLQADSVRKTCQNIWKFCYNHIQYKKDKAGTEQIRSPRRSWHDRVRGIDCDCFTVLIGSILSNLNIPFVMRLWRNSEPYFEHVYPVAFTPKGKEVIIDCVIDQFDQQAPYTEIKDIEMELQVLDGVESERYNEFGDKVYFETDLPIDAEDLGLSEDVIDLDGVDGLRDWMKRNKEKRKARKTDRKVKRAEKRKIPLKERVKEKVRNFGRKLNKVNPITALMRAGILASMKLNIMGVASKLRFAFWTPQQARRANMEMAKYSHLQSLRSKIERTFRKLGGDVKSLRKAILTGKGNRNRMVALNGLGAVTIPSEYDTLEAILGDEIIAAEFEESGIFDKGIDGLDGITLSAAIAAAAGFIGKIAGVFKKIGGIFKKGSKQDSQLQIQQNTEAQEDKTSKFSANRILDLVQRTRAANQFSSNQSSIPGKTPPGITEDSSFDAESFESADESAAFETGMSARSTSDSLPDNPEGDPGFIDTTEFDVPKESNKDNSKDAEKNNTPWYKNPWVIGGTAVLGLGIASYFIFRPKPKSVNGVSGVSKSKKKVKKKLGTPGKKAASTAQKKQSRRKATRSRKPKVQRVELQA